MKRAWAPGAHTVRLCVALSLAASTAAMAALRPNIVWILADDLGYGEIGCYGQTKIRTPHLNRLASEGMRFTRHYSGSPVCAPSRYVLLTGLHPGHAFIRDNREAPGGVEGQLDVPEATITLAERLKQAGYVTGLFGKWGLGTLEGPGNPSRQGFDHWFGYLCQRHAHSLYPAWLRENGQIVPLANDPPVPGHARFPKDLDPQDVRAYEPFKGREYAPHRIRQAVLEFIRKNRDRPFFLYYANVAPHLALMVPDEYVRRYPSEWDPKPYLGERGYTPHRTPRAAYAAYISVLDEDVGEVIRLLRELGLAQRTLVVFSSDNGPTHDVGGVDTEFFNSTGGLRGRKGSLYEGGIRVPAIAWWPGQIPAGVTTDFLSGFEDWVPTLTGLAGLPLPACDGVDLWPLLSGGTPPARQFLYREFAGYGGWQAVWKGPWKAVRANLQRKDPAPLRTELYNLVADPTESNDVAPQHPEIVAELESIMAREHTPSTEFPLFRLDGSSSGTR